MSAGDYAHELLLAYQEMLDIVCRTNGTMQSVPIVRERKKFRSSVRDIANFDIQKESTASKCYLPIWQSVLLQHNCLSIDLGQLLGQRFGHWSLGLFFCKNNDSNF